MKAFITVVGKDTVGVVARVSGLCSQMGINIEDISQSILQGMFAMIMLDPYQSSRQMLQLLNTPAIHEYQTVSYISLHQPLLHQLLCM